VFELKEGNFHDRDHTDEYPVGGFAGGKGLICANPADGHHLFSPDMVSEEYTGLIEYHNLPAVFSFLAKGDFISGGELEYALLDWESMLWLASGGEWTKQNILLGAGLWSFDIDTDGRDELVTTSRAMDSDRLEFYGFEDGYASLSDVSPVFPGRIIDAAFGDIDGDSNPEPVILMAFGFERKLIF
jgi:hypothetical protein